MRNELTEIAVVLDESGSMGSVRSDAIGGFNTFLKDQQSAPGNANLTLVKFNTKPKPVCESVDIRKAAPLTETSYVPGGGTALLDAVGIAINSLGKRLSDLPEADRPGKVIMAILTDGEENSSEEFDSAKIKEMIEHQRAKYNWEFLFLAANQDAWATGGSYGIKTCINYCATAVGTRDTLRKMSSSIKSYRATGFVDPNIANTP